MTTINKKSSASTDGLESDKIKESPIKEEINFSEEETHNKKNTIDFSSKDEESKIPTGKKNHITNEVETTVEKNRKTYFLMAGESIAQQDMKRYLAIEEEDDFSPEKEKTPKPEKYVPAKKITLNNLSNGEKVLLLKILYYCCKLLLKEDDECPKKKSGLPKTKPLKPEKPIIYNSEKQTDEYEQPEKDQRLYNDLSNQTYVETPILSDNTSSASGTSTENSDSHRESFNYKD